MKKITKGFILLVLIIAIIASILIINYYRNNGLNGATAMCIAEKSKLFVSERCGHCTNQKQILEPYLEKFELIDVLEHPEVWEKYNLVGVPSWIIDGKTYLGVQSVNNLKEITGC